MSTWSVLIATHAAAAVTSLPLGAVQVLRRPRGDGPHRRLGRVWAGLMLYVAVTSFWIRDLRHGSFSLLHVLSVITLVSVVAGVVAARRGNIARHRGNMLGAWLGSLGAFVGAVAVPDRLLPTLVVDSPGTAALAVTGVTAACAVTVALSGAAGRRRAVRPVTG
jgi:uncharacterized membrane protein